MVGVAVEEHQETDAEGLDAEGLDVSTIIRLLGEHNRGAVNCEDARAAFLFGATGAGKSLTLNYLLGKPVTVSTELVYDDDGRIISSEERPTVEGPLDGCEVGHSFDSKTRLLASHTCTDSDIVFVDTPGFEDTEGCVVDIANSIAISAAIRTCGSVRIILLIQADTLRGGGRGGELKKLLTIITRFVKDVNKQLSSVLVLFSHCHGTTSKQLYGALVKMKASLHMKKLSPLLDHMASLLDKHGDNLLLNPGGKVGKLRLPCLRKIINDMHPMEDVKNKVHAPLTEKALLQLTVAAKQMMQSIEAQVRSGAQINMLANDLDEFYIISSALDIEPINGNYTELVALIAEHIAQHCAKASGALKDKRAIDLCFHMERLDGFESLSEHFFNLKIDPKQHHYVPLLFELNSHVQQALAAVEALPLHPNAQSISEDLDFLKALHHSGRKFLDKSNQHAYTQARKQLINRFGALFDTAMNFVKSCRFDSHLEAQLLQLQAMEIFSSHFKNEKYWESVVAQLAKISEELLESCLVHLKCEEENFEVTEYKGGANQVFMDQWVNLLHLSQMDQSIVPQSADHQQQIQVKFNDLCNTWFSGIDRNLNEHTYDRVAYLLAKTERASQVDKQSTLTRYQEKLADINTRLEYLICDIHGGQSKLHWKEDYQSHVKFITRLSDAIHHLGQFLRGAEGFKQEDDAVRAYLIDVHQSVLTKSREAIEQTLEQNNSKTVVELLSQLQFMCGSTHVIDGDLHLKCGELIRFMHGHWTDQVQKLLCLASDADLSSTQKVSSRMATLLATITQLESIQSEANHSSWTHLFMTADKEQQHRTSKTTHASSSVNPSKRRKKSRQHELAPPVGISIKQEPVDAPKCTVMSEASSAEDMDESGSQKRKRDLSSDDPPTTLSSLLQDLQRSYEEAQLVLARRASVLGGRCRDFIQNQNFGKAHGCLESLDKLCPLDEYLPEYATPSTGSGRLCSRFSQEFEESLAVLETVLSENEASFEKCIQLNEMGTAQSTLLCVQSMLQLGDYCNLIVKTHKRIDNIFQQKTSQFNSDVNALIEGKNFSKLAAVMKGHKELGNSSTNARHEFDMARQQLNDCFRAKFEDGLRIIHAIDMNKPLVESKANELAEIMNEFELSRNLFNVLDDDEGLNSFSQISKNLCSSADSKFATLEQQCDSCIGRLEFRSFETCLLVLESLRFVSSLQDAVSKTISSLKDKMCKKIDSLPDEMDNAIRKTDYRRIDKIFRGLNRGLEHGIIAGRHIEEDFDALQNLLERHLRTMCKDIQSSLDSYDIKNAHVRLEQFRSLLVSEAVQKTEFNDNYRKKFHDEMDEIKKDILSARRMKEDPQMIALCLEGFKEVDRRFYKRQCDQFLDQLKGELETLGDELTRQNVSALKNLQQRVKDLKKFELALEGHGFDEEIQGYKQELVESLIETMHQAQQQFDTQVKKGCWDELQQPHKFLQKAVDILRTSGWIGKEQYSCIANFEQTKERLVQRGENINSRIEQLGNFELAKASVKEANDLVGLLHEWKKDEGLLKQSQVLGGISVNGSLADTVLQLTEQLDQVHQIVKTMWEAQQFESVGNVLQNVHALSTSKCDSSLMQAANQVLKHVCADIIARMQSIANDAIQKFKDAIVHGDTDLYRQGNASLEVIQKVEGAIASRSQALGLDKQIAHEDDIVRIIMKAIHDVDKSFREKSWHKSQSDVDAVAQHLIQIWGIPSEVSHPKVKEYAQSVVQKIFDDLQNAKDKSLFNFTELGSMLSDSGVVGEEMIHQFAAYFRAFSSHRFRNATARMTFTDSLTKLKELNQLSSDEELDLREAFEQYESHFKALLQQHFKLKTLVSAVLSTARSAAAPKLVAGISAVWSMTFANQSSAADPSQIPQPHPVQVLSVFRLLSKSKDSWLGRLIPVLKASKSVGHLVELKTGEGKSIVIGILAAFLALRGKQVDCVCYSSYLCHRDREAFAPIFKELKIEAKVTYGTFSTLAEECINSNGNVRQLAKEFLEGKRNDPTHSNRIKTTESSDRVLLIDEVDVFFSEEFYGEVYSPCNQVRIPEIIKIQEQMFEKLQHMSVQAIQQAVFKMPEYQSIVSHQHFKRCKVILDRAIAMMARDLKFFESSEHAYQLVEKAGHKMKIGYKSVDGVCTDTVYGYRTMFAYMKEFRAGKVAQDSMEQAMGLQIDCGHFSYAEFPHQYSEILGVTGTLSSLGKFEKEAIAGEYGIKDETITPSIYGDSQLTFRLVDDVHVEPDLAQFNRKIKEEILLAANANRAVLVYFESDTKLRQWQNSGYTDGIENLAAVTDSTQNIEHYIKQATRGKAATLLTKVHGRGLDFICHDKAVEEAGGVHVVQTFLSEQYSEEIQIKGRTARQDKKGTFKLILHMHDLSEKFNILDEEVNQAKACSKLYELLHGKRNDWFYARSKKREEQVKNAKAEHVRSERFQRNLQNWHAGNATKSIEKELWNFFM